MWNDLTGVSLYVVYNRWPVILDCKEWWHMYQVMLYQVTYRLKLWLNAFCLTVDALSLVLIIRFPQFSSRILHQSSASTNTHKLSLTVCQSTTLLSSMSLGLSSSLLSPSVTSALTMLVGRQEEDLAVKNWVMRCSHGWLSVCSKVKMICIWGWFHCHPAISCFIKIDNSLIIPVTTYLGCPENKPLDRCLTSYFSQLPFRLEQYAQAHHLGSLLPVCRAYVKTDLFSLCIINVYIMVYILVCLFHIIFHRRHHHYYRQCQQQ